ncbi:MAG: hypothetical protein C4329_07390 [Chitinophagaceae bacterium]|mgnify:CR=1 FL=1
MRFFLATILTALICFIAGLFLPWWSIALVAFLVALLIPQTLPNHFLSGFAGVFLLWAILAFWIDAKNESILSNKIAQLFHLGAASFLLIITTAFIGGLVGGFAAMSGGSLRKRKSKRAY